MNEDRLMKALGRVIGNILIFGIDKEATDELAEFYDTYILPLKIGNERYEKVRRLNARQFAELYNRCINDDLNFDEEVDKCG